MNARHMRQVLCRWSIVLAFSVLGQAAATAAHPPEAGDKAPGFLGLTLDGHRVSLGAYLGKVVVVSFWATWCPPCREELPILENIQKAGKGGIQVIAINTESREVFRSAAKIMATYHLLLTNDDDKRGFTAYGARGLPHLVVIGRDGRIVSVHSGYGRGEIPDLAGEINRALAAPLADAPPASAE